MNHNTYNWKTASVIKETEDAVTIIFETDGESFRYKPGQFINLRQIIDEEAVYRSYSLSSSPGVHEKPAITIKKVDGGKMSNHLYLHAEKINQWEVDGPHGSFYAEPFSILEKPVVLIGGGSGITPLYSILKTCLTQSDATVLLIDCNRTWDDVIFAKELTYLEEVYSDRLQIHHFLSRDNERTDFPCKNFRTERLSKLILKKILKKSLSEKISEAEYFLCGLNGLIELSEDVLESLGIPIAQIHRESFSPAAEKSPSIELPLTTKEVLLHYYEQTHLLEVHPGKSVLETALEDRIPLSYSCKSGTCGKCAARQSAGKLHLMNNYALTDDELKQGLVLLCQSFPLDDEVILTIE